VTGGSGSVVRRLRHGFPGAVPLGLAGFLVLSALLSLAACAPTVLPAGPPVTQPGFGPAAIPERLRMTDGAELPLRVWLPEEEAPSAVVLAVHGVNDYANAFDAAARHWAARGIATYAYDQRGFGGAPNRGFWPGEATLAGDLRAAAGVVRARHPGVRLIVLGESMGGAVVLVTATGPGGLDADGAVLVAPAVWGRATMGLVPRLALALVSRVAPWMRLSGRGLGVRPSDNEEMLRAFSRDPMVIRETRADVIRGLVDLMDAALAAAPRFRLPALIVYGEKDELVPKAPTALLLTRLPDDLPGAARQRVALYRDGWHMLLRDLQGETVWADIAAWVADPDAALPSGADRKARSALLRHLPADAAAPAPTAFR